ncbi:MAG: fibronectin type III domain-containing protein [Oscillospiraceae bacterium]|nr:fibronectin type III domain-containing protein [Oscillospiraceae bacterium]
MKRIISLVMVLALALSMCTVPVSAAKTSKVWDGSADTSWYTGKKRSYDISTPSQLAGLSKLVNGGNSMSGVVINLTADLVMNDTSDWTSWKTKAPKNTFTPIGLSGNPAKGYTAFAGVFNGNGHAIKGLYVNNGYVGGLFGYLYGGVVSNVIIDESVIISYDNGKGKGNYAGGIAGIAEGALINMCENNGYVRAIGPGTIEYGDREAYAGGIVGSMHSENASFAALGAVFAATGVWVNPAILASGNGGIIKSSGVMNCISSGDVYVSTGTVGYLGGIAGWGNNGDIRNCVSWNSYEWQKGKKIFGKYRGTIYGGNICGGASNCSVSNCAYWKLDELTAIGQDLKSSVVSVNRDATGYTPDNMRSEEFAKKYSDEYTYTTGDWRIYLSCDKRKASGGSSSAANASSVSISRSNGKITIKWGKTANAAGYRVCYLKSNGKYAVLTNTTGTSATLKGLKSGTKYTMLIQAKFKDGTVKTIKDGKFSFTA